MGKSTVKLLKLSSKALSLAVYVSCFFTRRILTPQAAVLSGGPEKIPCKNSLFLYSFREIKKKIKKVGMKHLDGWQ